MLIDANIVTWNNLIYLMTKNSIVRNYYDKQIAIKSTKYYVNSKWGMDTRIYKLSTLGINDHNKKNLKFDNKGNVCKSR